MAEKGTRDEIFSNMKHPYTKTLLGAVPRIGEAQHEFNRIVGDVPSPLDPPSGCHFHPRCPKANDICRQQYPDVRTLDTADVACHFPANERK